jgi:NAD+ diphosphatase
MKTFTFGIVARIDATPWLRRRAPYPAAMAALLTNLLLSRSTIDRQAHLRKDDQWLTAARNRPESRVIWVSDGRVAMDDAGRLLESPLSEVAADTETAFLGTDADGVAVFCAHVPELPAGRPGVGLREMTIDVDDRASGLMVTAIALSNWLATHTRCPRCGERTVAVDAGWSRRCPADGSQHFPRTDPAIIVLAIDDADRALLGRQSRWQPEWFSTLAGFVEPGESAEHAVRREVHEESGVVIGGDVDDVQYLGSQPWPFPGSLMLGYHARAVGTQIHVDGEEIAEAHWFSRTELADACQSGVVRLPPAVSIARRLIERWYGLPINVDWIRP